MKTVLITATTAAMTEQFNKENIVLLKRLGYVVRVAGNWNQGKKETNDWYNRNMILNGWFE